MNTNDFKMKDRAWWMLFLFPVACWLSGWQGGAGLIFGWAASALNLRLMRSPFGKKTETAMEMQVLVLKSVLLRFLAIIGAMVLGLVIAKIFGKQDALFWDGGAILAGQFLMIASAAVSRGRLGGENHGRDQDR